MNTLSLSTLSAAVATAFIFVAAAPIIQYGDRASLPDDSVALPSAKSRAEVRAEAVRAARGAAIGGDGALDRALFADFQSTKSRAQVVAELRAAQRLGVLPQRGDAEPVVVTAAQAEEIRQAGLAAARERVAQGR
jgi:hypothetical protein